MNKELLQCLLKYDIINDVILDDLEKLEKMIDEAETFKSGYDALSALCKVKGGILDDMAYKIYEAITE